MFYKQKLEMGCDSHTKPIPLLKQSNTHRKHHHRFLFLFHHHRQIMPDLEPAKCLVDEHVADLRRWDEPGRRGQQVART